MNRHSEEPPDWEAQRNRIIGLGETSIRKSYYPELQQRIQELEKKNEELNAAYEEMTATDEDLRQQIAETGRKEQELRASEERFRNLIEASPVPIVLARDGLFIYTNSAFCRMTGYECPDDILGKHLLEFVAPECRERVAGYVHSRNQGEPAELHYESTGVRRDGTIFPYEITIAVIELSDGPVTMAFITDITRRKKIERDLAESRDYLNTILASVKAGIILIDAKSREIIDINATAASMIGLPRDKIIGNFCHRFLCPSETGSCPVCDLGMEVDNSERVLLTADGNELPVIKNVARISISGRDCLLETFIDNTERKRAEETLRESEERFHSLYANMIDGAALHELTYDENGIPDDYIIIETNPAFEKHLGISRDRVIGKTSRDAYGVDEPPYLETYARVVSTGEPEVFETYFPSIDKHFSISAYCPSKGHFATIFEDITERKRAEDALARSGSRLKRAEFIAGLGHWEFDLATRNVRVSDGARAIYGLSGKDWSIRDVQKIPLPECRPMLDEALRALVAENRPYDVEFRIRRPTDGEILDIHSLAEYDPKADVVFGVIQDITDRKRAENALRDNEAFLTSIIENLPPMLFVKDARDHRFVRFNRAGEELIGHTREEMIGKNDYDLFPKEQADFFTEKDRLVLKGKIPIDIPEEKIRTRAHGERILHTRKIPILDQSGEPRFLLGISEDITERKIQEHILKSQLDLGIALQKISGLRETLETCLSAAIKIANMDAGGIYLVDAASGALDLAVSHNIGDEFVKIISHYPADSVNAQMVMDGKPIYAPYRETGVVHTLVHDREGLRVIGIIPISFGGRVTACLNVSSHTLDEISPSGRIALETLSTQIGAAIEQKKAEDALRDSEERYRSLVDITDTGYLVLDSQGLVIDANDVYVRLTGRSSLEELIGRPVTDWTAPHDLERNAREVEKCMKTGHVRSLEIDYIRPDGTLQPVEINATVFHTASGDIILTLCRDISARKRTNVALQQARNKLNLLNAVTFQDIQTAAFSLAAYQELVKTALSDPKARSYIDKQEIFLKKMVDTLDFAKNYQEMGIQPPRWQNVRQVFLYAISHLDFLHMKQNLHLDNLEVFADPLFEKALFNIMQNVLEHGIRATEVTLHYEHQADSLLLIIEDNGVGIPAEEKHMIFDRGYGKGTGLGLFLVREVLSITGMNIRETGISGQGTRFEITVPRGVFRVE